jgi:hypothetical protein
VADRRRRAGTWLGSASGSAPARATPRAPPGTIATVAATGWPSTLARSRGWRRAARPRRRRRPPGPGACRHASSRRGQRHSSGSDRAARADAAAGLGPHVEDRDRRVAGVALVDEDRDVEAGLGAVRDHAPIDQVLLGRGGEAKRQLDRLAVEGRGPRVGLEDRDQTLVSADRRARRR